MNAHLYVILRLWSEYRTVTAHMKIVKLNRVLGYTHLTVVNNNNNNKKKT